MDISPKCFKMLLFFIFIGMHNISNIILNYKNLKLKKNHYLVPKDND